ncbi:aspartyl-tRNA amidotransferase [Vulcanibacillus modesticaldus]|uniref:Aspartyl-tRNA amidotransferase n=1 Tax=Vulcanibacillus modesticaldus TaxID=337097 RepID=A0A1D2YSB4_9BACI|nr:GatB/YqeY domain-containing protein [Vulcanibacillus modesticaldus]OEF96953.1 aspartyl-tRNA amidotransferase [Vulcanibacillus modesticaldus]
MSLMDRINEDMKQAMKDKDKFKLSVIRMIRSAIKYAEIENKGELSDEQIVDVLTRELKQRRDSLQEFEKANRTELAEKVKNEIDILQEYLPEQLSEEELRQVVQDTINEVGATSKKDMGKVMGTVMPKVKGRADGKLINKLVQELLS